MFKKSPNVGLLWKNDACWSVSASDHLLTVPQRELTYVMLPSGSAAAGDVAVSVSRGSSTSTFTGLPSHEIQQMPCRGAGGLFTINTMVALHGGALSTPTEPGELAEKGCVLVSAHSALPKTLSFLLLHFFPPCR